MLPAAQFKRAGGLFANAWKESGNKPQQWQWVSGQHSFAEDLVGATAQGFWKLGMVPKEHCM